MITSLLLPLIGAALAGPADDLAARVADACGPVYTMDTVAFTFVVEVGGEEKARRAHVWRPQTGEVQVSSGGTVVTLKDVRAGAPSDAEDPRWADIAPGVEPEAALKAWGGFVNDSYWLIAPCKVNDPGVSRAVTEDGALTLSFDAVGLTPGDQYTLRVDEVGRVTGWSFVLQSEREGDFTWTQHQDFGPLNLSLHRATADGGTVIRFEGVSVSPPAPAE